MLIMKNVKYPLERKILTCPFWKQKKTTRVFFLAQSRALSSLPVDIARIKLTIGFVHYVWKLPNTLMPLSSLAAEPARITIPNEPARGESNFFQALSLCLSSFVLAGVFVAPTVAEPRPLSFFRPRRSRPAISFPRGPWKPNKNKQICLYRKCPVCERTFEWSETAEYTG